MAYIILSIIIVILIVILWAVTRGKGDSTDSITGRINANNIATGSGLADLKTNNTNSGKIIDTAQGVAGEGLSSIENTESAISRIIANAKKTINLE